MPTISTLLLVRKRYAQMIIENFVPNLEIKQLLAIKPSQIGDIRMLGDMVNDTVINDAKKIYPDTRIHYDFMFEYIITQKPDIFMKIADKKLDNEWRYILRVEPPSPHNQYYQNIDIGPTSNGKSLSGEFQTDTAARETAQEASISLDDRGLNIASRSIQEKTRERLKLEFLPYVVDSSIDTRMFIVILDPTLENVVNEERKIRKTETSNSEARRNAFIFGGKRSNSSRKQFLTRSTESHCSGVLSWRNKNNMPKPG